MSKKALTSQLCTTRLSSGQSILVFQYFEWVKAENKEIW